MNDYIDAFLQLLQTGSIFWFCALTGTGMFLIQSVINLFGISDYDSLEPSDASFEQEVDLEVSDARRFKWLSMHTITGFFMTFGWSAITCQEQYQLSTALTVSISLFFGLLTALTIHLIFRFAKKLKSPGNVYTLEEAIGKEGYLYQSIPKGGRGKIIMTIQDLTHEIDAISYHPQDLPSFIPVKVIEKRDENTVVVAPI
jgi:hypothetical protein